MHYHDDEHHLDVEIETVNCEMPDDEKIRIPDMFLDLGEAVSDLPSSELHLKVIFHSYSQSYHVEGALHLPGAGLFTGVSDDYLDTALERCAHKLARRTIAYREQPDRGAVELAKLQKARDQIIIAPEDPEIGPIAEAVQQGDYRAFRLSLSVYEDWLRKRAGRWVQRYPEAQAKLGDKLLLGDLVEEIYLNAFERFLKRPTDVPLHKWLDDLIDPSLKELVRHPAEEHEAAGLARTSREFPVP